MSDQRLSDEQNLSELVHEMRNQLAVARANLEAFADGKLEPSRDRLESVLQSISHLERLIGDLGSSEATIRREVRPSRVNVCGLLYREFRAMDALAQQKKIALSVTRCSVEAPACLHFYGDPERIGQIVHNVLLNALRYTPDGGTIHVDCSRRADQIEVTVADSGPGISDQELSRVFEPGFRGAAGREAGSSGYGLAIAKELVEAHGGAIEVTHSSPRGTRFTVTLPTVPEPI